MSLFHFSGKFFSRWAWTSVATAKLVEFKVLASPLMFIIIDCFRKVQLVFINISSVLLIRHLW
jgi:hypothetical protein